MMDDAANADTNAHNNGENHDWPNDLSADVTRMGLNPWDKGPGNAIDKNEVDIAFIKVNPTSENLLRMFSNTCK